MECNIFRRVGSNHKNAKLGSLDFLNHQLQVNLLSTFVLDRRARVKAKEWNCTTAWSFYILSRLPTRAGCCKMSWMRKTTHWQFTNCTATCPEIPQPPHPGRTRRSQESWGCCTQRRPTGETAGWRQAFVGPTACLPVSDSIYSSGSHCRAEPLGVCSSQFAKNTEGYFPAPKSLWGQAASRPGLSEIPPTTSQNYFLGNAENLETNMTSELWQNILW